jgi:hypothetical protein
MSDERILVNSLCTFDHHFFVHPNKNASVHYSIAHGETGLKSSNCVSSLVSAKY